MMLDRLAYWLGYGAFVLVGLFTIGGVLYGGFGPIGGLVGVIIVGYGAWRFR